MECHGRYQTDRERWLEARKNGLGASDAACILGKNPWKTNVRLWEEKTRLAQSADIGDKPAVRYGSLAEDPLRELFALDYPQYSVDYDQYGMVFQPERPWLFATLDGALTDTATQERGVLEIKTTEIQNAAAWKQWDGRVPDHYYAQVLHQLLATGFSFAILKAQIKFCKDSDMQLSTRHYRFDRERCRDDLAYLLEKETAFWALVQNRTRPALLLPEI